MNFSIPNYCEFYKNLLVEEIVLCDNPAILHYGKCSVIGYAMRKENGAYVLGSISIPNIPRTHQLPDCFLELRLFMDFPRNLLNCTVEIYGEVMLITKDTQPNEMNLLSAHSLIIKLRELQRTFEEAKNIPPREPSGMNDKSMHSAVRLNLQKEIQLIKSKYIPIIKVHTVRKIEDAREIIAENLKIKHFQKSSSFNKPNS